MLGSSFSFQIQKRICIFFFKGKNPLQVILMCNFNNKNTELMKPNWGKQIPA